MFVSIARPALNSMHKPFSSTCSSVSLAREKSRRVFWLGMGCLATYKIFDIGLANFFGLETLIHGTSPKGYIGINLKGVDPSFGGNPNGATALWVDICTKFEKTVQENTDMNDLELEEMIESTKDMYRRTNGYFFVMANKSMPLNCQKENSSKLSEILDDQFWYILMPRIFSINSGIAQMWSSQANSSELISRAYIGILLGLYTPTLKFRFKPEVFNNLFDESTNTKPFFERDPDLDPLYAYKTKDSISPDHLGITGSLLQGIDQNTFQRMKDRPLKVLSGSMLIGMSYKIACNTYHSFKRGPLNPKQEIRNQKSLSFPHRVKRLSVKIAKNCMWKGVALAILAI